MRFNIYLLENKEVNNIEILLDEYFENNLKILSADKIERKVYLVKRDNLDLRIIGALNKCEKAIFFTEVEFERSKNFLVDIGMKRSLVKIDAIEENFGKVKSSNINLRMKEILEKAYMMEKSLCIWIEE